MKKIGVLTSGGDAPGMNAAVRAAVRTGISMGMEVYGIERGYEGLLDGDVRKLEWKSVGDILQRGGTILRTARSERFMTDEGQEHAMRILETFGIEGVVVIGGDGSFRGGLDLSRRGIRIMGIPGTIDNDLGYTDYTIGFDTAVNTVLSLISNIRVPFFIPSAHAGLPQCPWDPAARKPSRSDRKFQNRGRRSLRSNPDLIHPGS